MNKLYLHVAYTFVLIKYMYICMTRFASCLIDQFRDIPMDSQTTDITHFAVVFRYDVTIKALETIRSTSIYL